MPSKTKFQHSWLSAVDCNGHTINQWCKKTDNMYEAHCFLCNKSFACNNGGLDQVKQHAAGKKHKKNTASLSSNQGKLQVAQTSVPNAGSFNRDDENTIAGHVASNSGLCVRKNSDNAQPVKLYFYKEEVLKSEIYWCLQASLQNFTFRSFDGLGELFKAMFPDSKIAQDFSVARTKAAYLLTDALAPYFVSELVKEVNNSGSTFTLHYDESTQAQVKKQLDVHFRFLSGNKVVCRYFKSLMFGHAKGDDVSKRILDCLNEAGLDLRRFMALGSDGPNVNKRIQHNINNDLKTAGYPGLLDIGSCNLHIIHNAFHKGMQSFCWDLEELLVDLYNYFHMSAARREDLNQIQVELGICCYLPMKHVQSRWLTMGPAVTRFVDQHGAFTRYFKEAAAKPTKEQPTSAAYRRICAMLLTHGKETLVKCYFIQSVFPIFEEFLKLFQTEACVVHILHDRLCELITSVMLRYVKMDCVKQNGKPLPLYEIQYKLFANQLTDDELQVGENTRKTMRLTAVQNHKQRLLLEMRKFFTTTTEYLLDRLPLKNQLLRDIRCLNPLLKNECANGEEILRIARKLTGHITANEVTQCVDEWKMYQIGDNPKFEVGDRIDVFWADVLKEKKCDGSEKYTSLKTLVRAVLVLPHGNSDVERGFSENAYVVTEQKTQLDEKTISAIRVVKDVVKHYDHKPQCVPITKELLTGARYAHRTYVARLREEKEKEKERLEALKKQNEIDAAKEAERLEKEKRLRENQETLKKKEKEFGEQEKRVEKEVDASQQLLQEASEKLTLGIKNNDMKAISVSQLMISVAQKEGASAREKLAAIRAEQKKIETKKRKLIDTVTADITAPKLMKKK